MNAKENGPDQDDSGDLMKNGPDRDCLGGLLQNNPDRDYQRYA
jgi:hypothetical protein